MILDTCTCFMFGWSYCLHCDRLVITDIPTAAAWPGLPLRRKREFQFFQSSFCRQSLARHCGPTVLQKSTLPKANPNNVAKMFVNAYQTMYSWTSANNKNGMRTKNIVLERLFARSESAGSPCPPLLPSQLLQPKPGNPRTH